MADQLPAPPRILELRLLPLAAGAWASAYWGVRISPAAGWCLCLILGGSAAVVVVLGVARAALPAPLSRHARAAVRSVAVPAALSALIFGTAALQVERRTEGPIGGAIEAQASLTGNFRAASDARKSTPDRFSNQPRFLLEAVLVDASSGGRSFAADTPILVIGGPDYSSIHLGDQFSAAGRLAETEPGDRAAAILRAGRAPDVTPAGGWYSVTARLRTTFSEACSVLGGDAAQLLPGMVLGDRSRLSPDLEGAMKNTGLTHLTAVSGANIGFLLAFVFLVTRALRIPRAAAAAAGLAAVLAFVLLVRPDPSVLRAAVMGSLGVIAVLTGRGRLAAALLWLCMVLLLAVDPWLAASYGFILSVLATMGLILLGPHLARALSRWMPQPAAVLVAVPLSAQLFCSPVLVLLQPQVPVYSLPANLAAAPLTPMVTVVGTLAVPLAAMAPGMARLPLEMAGAGAAWVAAVARLFDSLPGSLLPWPGGVTGTVLMVAAGALSAGALLVPAARARARSAARPGSFGSPDGFPGWLPPVSGHGWMRGRKRGRGRLRTGLACLLAVLMPVAGAGLWGRTSGPLLPGSWEAAACDVGQGDGLVVRTGETSALVIDTGPEPEAMNTCLTDLGIESVDLLVLTHAHADHYGGVEGVASGRRVDRIGYSTADPVLPPALERALAGIPGERIRLVRGMEGRSGPAQWEVLWPPAQKPALSENDASAVLLITIGVETAPLRLLFTGDLEAESAAELLRLEPDLARQRLDVLKVAHHGARNGGTTVIDRLKPRLALISVGAGNDYGHPAEQILSALAAGETPVVRTDLLGTVCLARSGTQLQVFAAGRRLNRRRGRPGRLAQGRDRPS